MNYSKILILTHQIDEYWTKCNKAVYLSSSVNYDFLCFPITMKYNGIISFECTEWY